MAKKKHIKDSDYLLNFRTPEERALFKHYKRASIDLETNIVDLIIEAMQYYEEKWK